MSRIIGMGETVMDILFHKQGNVGGADAEPRFVPFASTPGGSTFNSMISVGRSNVPCLFIGYTGDNRVGQEIAAFLRENNVSTEYFQIRDNERAALSLAYLDSNGDADYTFYKDEPQAATHYSLPRFTDEDYMLYGSYYSICAGLRPQVVDALTAAHRARTIIYYDVNLRPSHSHQLDELTPRILENCRLSTIVRGSADDFRVLFNCTAPEEIYVKHISAHCPVFICTAGAGSIVICSPSGTFHFDAPRLPLDEIVSTVGAGDSFNAGMLCAMCERGIRREDFAMMGRDAWLPLVERGTDYASQVCCSRDNYIARE